MQQQSSKKKWKDYWRKIRTNKQCSHTNNNGNGLNISSNNKNGDNGNNNEQLQEQQKQQQQGLAKVSVYVYSEDLEWISEQAVKYKKYKELMITLSTK